MKTKIILFLQLYFVGIVMSYSQVAQFPQVYMNGQGSGGSNIYIHQSASYSSSNLTLLNVNSKIGAVSLSTNSSDSWYNWVKVCLPSTSSTNNTPNYGFIPCDYFYARIDESNNYATVNTTSTPLGVRTCAGCTTQYVKLDGQNTYFGKNSIVALTGNSTNISGVIWYEVHLTMNCSQYTGWISGAYLAFPTQESYYIVGGNVCDNPTGCEYIGNINGATISFGSTGTTYSSSDFYQYKLPKNWSGNITCTHPSYNTSTPSSYNYTAKEHNYTKQFVLSNTIACTAPTTQSNNILFSNVGQSSITLNWTSGNGSRRVVKINTSNSFTAPNDGIDPTANPVYSVGQQVVYNGSESNVIVSGLTAGVTYWFRVYEANCTGSNSYYKTSTSTNNPNTTTTTQSTCEAVTISTQPQSQTKTVGITATFSVSASGTPPFTYQWYKNGSSISSQTNSSYTTPTLTSNDNGNTYKCYITNCNGNSNITSNTATLTVNNSTGNISGSITAPSIKESTGYVQDNIVSSTVNMFLAGSSSSLYSISNTSGSFSFTGLSSTLYDIEVNQTLNGIIYKTKETNVSVNTSNLILKLSSLIIDQISQYNNELEHLNCYMKDLGHSVNLSSYNLNNSKNFINSKKSIINSDNEDIEKLARLAMSERMLLKYYDQAETMGQEFVLSTDAFFETSFNLLKMLFCDKTSWLNDFFLENALDFLKEKVEYPINNIDSPNKILYNSLIDGVFDGFKSGLKNKLDVSLNLIYNSQRENIQPKVLRFQLESGYLDNSIDIPNIIVDKAQYWIYSGNLTNTSNSNLNLLNASKLKTDIAQAYADGYRNNPEWVNFITKLSQDATTATCLASKYISLLGLGTTAIHFYFVTSSISESDSRINELISEVKITAPNSFVKSRRYSDNIFNNSIQEKRSTASETALTNFDSEYLETISEISNGNYSNLIKHVDSLSVLNHILNFSISDQLNGIKSTIPFSAINDSMYFNGLKNTLFGSPFVRFANIISLAYFAQNTNEIELRDSIIAHSKELLASNTLMLSEINTMTTTLNGIYSPAYLTIINNDLPLTLQINSKKTFNLAVKNYGSTIAHNVYLKISIDGQFKFSNDSIFIGDLDVNEEKNTSCDIVSPSTVDTVSYYNIRIFCESGLTRPLGGAIRTTKLNTGIGVVDINETIATIFPNPTTGKIEITKIEVLGNDFKLEIYDYLGKSIYKSIINNVDKKISFDLSAFPKGLYLLKLSNKERSFQKKVIKM